MIGMWNTRTTTTKSGLELLGIPMHITENKTTMLLHSLYILYWTYSVRVQIYIGLSVSHTLYVSPYVPIVPIVPMVHSKCT